MLAVGAENCLGYCLTWPEAILWAEQSTYFYMASSSAIKTTVMHKSLMRKSIENREELNSHPRLHILSEQIDHCHTDRHTVFYLLQDNALVAIGYIAGNFNATVDGARVHDDNLFVEAIEQLFVEAVLEAVFA